MSQIQWFVQTAPGNVSGPFAAEMLKKLAADGHLKPEHSVRRGAEGNWVSARAVKGLFADTGAALPAIQTAPLQPVVQAPFPPIQTRGAGPANAAPPPSSPVAPPKIAPPEELPFVVNEEAGGGTTEYGLAPVVQTAPKAPAIPNFNPAPVFNPSSPAFNPAPAFNPSSAAFSPAPSFDPMPSSFAPVGTKGPNVSPVPTNPYDSPTAPTQLQRKGSNSYWALHAAKTIYLVLAYCVLALGGFTSLYYLIISFFEGNVGMILVGVAVMVTTLLFTFLISFSFFVLAQLLSLHLDLERLVRYQGEILESMRR